MRAGEHGCRHLHTLYVHMACCCRPCHCYSVHFFSLSPKISNTFVSQTFVFLCGHISERRIEEGKKKHLLFHSLAMHRCVGEEEWHRGVVMNLEIFSQRVTRTLFAVLQCLSQSRGKKRRRGGGGRGGGQLGLVFRCDECSLLPQSTGWVVKSLPLRRKALAEGKKCINSSLQLNGGAALLHYRQVCNLLQEIISLAALNKFRSVEFGYGEVIGTHGDLWPCCGTPN